MILTAARTAGSWRPSETEKRRERERRDDDHWVNEGTALASGLINNPTILSAALFLSVCVCIGIYIICASFERDVKPVNMGGASEATPADAVPRFSERVFRGRPPMLCAGQRTRVTAARYYYNNILYSLYALYNLLFYYICILKSTARINTRSLMKTLETDVKHKRIDIPSSCADRKSDERRVRR